jgi:ferredoxin
MPRIPALDLSRCTRCDACLEVCPEVFILNSAGYLEVVDLPAYAEECVEEAIRYCPAVCISWENRP